jgi:8-amino-7-oxononanoate synthase
LTAGRPAALASPLIARAIAGDLAALIGTERATLARSTLHAFWDLFVILARDARAIYVDAGTYPIARWGVERAAAKGVRAQVFEHHDPAALRERLRREIRSPVRPLVVADGFCPACGGRAPIGDYLDAMRRYGGRLVLDDTQALGVFGSSPGEDAPYGRGGGGSLRWSGIGGPDVFLVSSLAKAFGVPLAMLGASRKEVTRFEAESETRVHCSPPSFADLHAAERALQLNRARGDALRLRLAALVRRFRDGLAGLGLASGNSLFPVQSLIPASGLDGETLQQRLLRSGVRAVLHRPQCRPDPTVSFLVTAAHTPGAVDRAIAALAAIVATGDVSVPMRLELAR